MFSDPEATKRIRGERNEEKEKGSRNIKVTD
jgi:hypothetical protein